MDVTRSDAALLALRPALPVSVTADDTPVARFLHITLRPLLKLQNQLLLAVVADFVRDHHVPLGAAGSTERQRLLAELLSRNTKLRYLVVGLVLGQFTEPELHLYQQHRPELNRRILELASRRVQDQAATVAELSGTP
ncbi:hypothetical protein [Hymenobacter metallilatus]|uniref:Glyoxalase n=1 Tax=Hymenobacter metallilatus TaxID=2493666 RepID=A0A3R9N254_9BACT|nr:hypothetical protein [Hymenobacter metallilatus]RSK37211.1 hypothetical protein EI290_00685 [Hymenobacter metallilatus]